VRAVVEDMQLLFIFLANAETFENDRCPQASELEIFATGSVTENRVAQFLLLNRGTARLFRSPDSQIRHCDVKGYKTDPGGEKECVQRIDGWSTRDFTNYG
jgi:hypothetical protein